MTKYLVFKQKDEGWFEELSQDARSAQSAIRKHMEDNTVDSGGMFVAVPARSWQPVKVQVEQALKFST